MDTAYIRVMKNVCDRHLVFVDGVDNLRIQPVHLTVTSVSQFDVDIVADFFSCNAVS